MRRPAALLGLAALLIAQPAAAAPGCDLIRAMVGLDDKALTGIAVATRADGTFDLLYKGKPTMAKGASECDLDGPADDLEITCSWDAPDLDAAKAMVKLAATDPVKYQTDPAALNASAAVAKAMSPSMLQCWPTKPASTATTDHACLDGKGFKR